MPSVELKQVTYIYKLGDSQITALNGVSFSLNKGESLLILGQNGSGKSTLALLLNGILTPTKGQVLIEEQDTCLKKVKNNLWSRVGLVFQNPETQFFEETVFKEIAFGLFNMGLSKNEVYKRVLESLEDVGLDFDLFKDVYPWTLSGGEKRRVALACVLAMKPQILVLDEPMAGIDLKGKEKILALIKKLQKEKNITLVMITHYMEDVIDLADKVLVLDKGKAKMYGAPQKIFSKPEELIKLGLALPFEVDLFFRLKAKNVLTKANNFSLDKIKEDIFFYWSQKRDNKR